MRSAEQERELSPRDGAAAEEKLVVSACLVVRNEGAILERCLASLDEIDGEIVVVHDGSCDDDTLDIARRHGARVFVRPFLGYAEPHRTFAYAQARGEWLLSVDADEFLSPEMAAALPELTARTDVDGYEFVWPLWDGARPLSFGGPHRLVLMRRSAIELVGIIQRGPTVHGAVEARPEVLHHQPPYDNFSLRTAVTKQRRWARLHGRDLTRPFSDFDTFNYTGPREWPLRRRVLNWLSPVLAVPYGLGTFARVLRDPRWKTCNSTFGTRLRVGFAQGVYRTMVELYAARYVYLEPLMGRRRSG